jgi:trimeric autotransporter adhesin
MKFRQRMTRPVICSSVAVLLGLSMVSRVHAAPQGGQIVGGSGSITQSNLITNIQQNTQNLAINWNSFDVSKNETVNFVQPNSSAIALNRILGGSTSQIFGQINANGKVVL